MSKYNDFSNDTAHIDPSALPVIYREQFQVKHQQLGGEMGFLGKPTTDVELCPDRLGLYQHFQGGSLYWHDGQIYEIHGAIRDKWAALGWERSFLGYPVTDEMTTPDGIGRYNHFQHGSIYWTSQTGAWEVHGAILEKWAELGWERGWLGYPISDEHIMRDNGRQSDFQHGSIYWRSDTGAVEFGECRLWFTGLICFGEQSPINEKGDSDEPYLIVSIYDGNDKVATVKFPPDQPSYNEVNSGDVIEFRGECYHGRPRNLNLRCILMEHDEGDPNAYRDQIDNYVRTTIVAGESVAAALGTPISIPPEAGDLLTQVINALAMTGDDLIAEGYESYSWMQISQMISGQPQEERGIPYHFSTYLTDGDATYKAYFLFER